MIKEDDGALAGLRLLQVRGTLPQNYCSLLLADLGMEVIKVQSVSEPWQRQAYADAEDAQKFVDVINRNKKSIALDMHPPEGKEVFYKLATSADVILEGMRPGVAKELQIDYETLKKLNPGLIYCAISSYGQNGPYRHYRAHDHNCMGVAGAMSLFGDDSSKPPTLPPLPVGDMASGLAGAFGILTALRARDRSGKGQLVDISMMDMHVSFLSSYLGEFFSSGIVPRAGNIRMFQGPWARCYVCKDDKYVVLESLEPPAWAAFCKEINKEEWARSPFSWEKRLEEEDIARGLKQLFRQKTRDEWVNLLAPKGIIIAPVNDFADMLKDPQVQARQLIFEVEDPAGHKVKQIRHPVVLSETPARFKHLKAGRGAHTRSILEGLGYRAEEIAALYRNKVVK